MKRNIIRIAVLLLTLLCFILVAAKLSGISKTSLVTTTGQTFEKGTVTSVIEDNITESGTRVGQQQVEVLMKTGEKKGQSVIMTSSAGYLFGAACKTGMNVIVMQSVSGDTVVSSVYSQDRGNVIILFAIFYLVLLCLIGGKKGLRGAAGLVFTFFMLIYIELPLIYLGYSPFITSVAVCVITTIVTLYFIGGISKKTLVAISGTVSGVIISGMTAGIFSLLTGLSGWNVSNIESLLTLWETNEIQVGGLLFSGILISSLGAVMDVAMSISSSMQEIAFQNPSIESKELFKEGMRVGRDMMGTDSNTLILAFAGTGLSTLVLDYSYDLPFLQIINSGNIGIEIMQGLSGSFGVVLCVPVTVAIGAALIKRS